MCRFFTTSVVVLLALQLVHGQDPKKPDTTRKPAEQPRPMPGVDALVNQILQRMDENKDGRISKSEARNRVADGFERIDANKDGYLDRTELATVARLLNPGPPGGGPGMPPGQRPGGFSARIDPADFDSWDRDADGRLTTDELRANRFSAQFATIDRNKDGKIDPKEWASFHSGQKK